MQEIQTISKLKTERQYGSRVKHVEQLALIEEHTVFQYNGEESEESRKQDMVCFMY